MPAHPDSTMALTHHSPHGPCPEAELLMLRHSQLSLQMPFSKDRAHTFTLM